MEQSKWKHILEPLLAEQSDECIFGVGKRSIKSEYELHVYTGTTSSKQIGAAIYNAAKNLGEAKYHQGFVEYRDTDDYNFNEPEEFVLGAIFLENTDALIGWDYFDDSVVFIPWQNITSMSLQSKKY